jgi:hypothetical protein
MDTDRQHPLSQKVQKYPSAKCHSHKYSSSNDDRTNQLDSLLSKEKCFQITKQQDQNKLAKDGRLLVKANLDLHPTAQLPDPMPTTTGLEKDPPIWVSYKSQVAPGTKPVPSTDEI